VLNPGYGNLALRRFMPTHDDAWGLSLAEEETSVELWDDPHDAEHDANWSARALLMVCLAHGPARP